MAMGKQIGEFSYTATSVTVDADDNTTIVNYEGEATGLGTVLSTCVFQGADQEGNGGAFQADATAYLEDGSIAVAQSHGAFAKSGHHQWTVKAINLISDGNVVLGEGVVDLASRTFKGTMFEWD